MENSEMSKPELVAILVMIREIAKKNGEEKTVKDIDKILEEVKQK